MLSCATRRPLSHWQSLFWDAGVSGDGTACASCHFHAGAGSRIKNQLSPGLLQQDGELAGVFNSTASGGTGGPNYTLQATDFPFHHFTDPNNRESGVFFTTDDVAASAGSVTDGFSSIEPPNGAGAQGGAIPADQCNETPDFVFNALGIGTRKVEPRNAPTVINSVFTFRNLWDERASNSFNGIDALGNRSAQPTILVAQTGGVVQPTRIRLANSSLASQAVNAIETLETPAE